MANQILSVAIKNGEVSVRFRKLLSESLSRDSAYPGKGSDPVPPSVDFAEALSALTESLVSGCDLSDGYEWMLASVAFTWDAEGSDYGFKAALGGYKRDSAAVKVSIEQKSPDYTSTAVKQRLSKVESEALKFVGGKSSQGNLFEAAELEAAA